MHWHGVDVPNAEDGVAGVTQNAVMPGESHTYRFVVNETGKPLVPFPPNVFDSGRQRVVRRLHHPAEGRQTGRDGSGRKPREKTTDITVFSHDWETPEGHDNSAACARVCRTRTHRIIQPGTKVRLRLINSASLTKIFSLNGTPFRVSAIDGWDINEPEEVTGKRLKIGGGGRYDVTFTMPDHPVTLALHGEDSEPPKLARLQPRRTGNGGHPTGRRRFWIRWHTARPLRSPSTKPPSLTGSF